MIKFLLFFFCSFSLFGTDWPEQTLQKMTLREKIGQLFMIPVWTTGPDENVQSTALLIEKHAVGNLIFMQGTIEAQRAAAKLLQKKSNIPLLIGQDNEWGLDLRLKGSLRFPRNLTLGALNNPRLMYEFGKEIALQCQGVGVHINFAPVIDINNNPLNPVINDRSFGEDPQQVTDYGNYFMKGLQDQGVMACAKHFPGHGDTHIDSHHALPVIEKTKEMLSELEWKPFKKLIDSGVKGIMSAHLLFPQFDPSLPASLSPHFLEAVLKNDFGFKGLIFTDSFKMNAISSHYDDGESDLLALLAGNDIVLRFTQIEKALKHIEKAVLSEKIAERTLDEKVLKILREKELLGLVKDPLPKSVDLFSKKALHLKERLFKEAITLIQNQEALPIPSNLPIAFVQIGRDVIMKDALEIIEAPYEEQCPKGPPPFFKSLKENLSIDFFFLPKKAGEQDLERLKNALKAYSLVVIGVYEMNKFERLNFGLCPSTFSLLNYLKKAPCKVYLSLFGSPYSLKYFEHQEVILMAYENDEDAQIGAAEILLGKRKSSGQLPVTASVQYPLGYGLINNPSN